MPEYISGNTYCSVCKLWLWAGQIPTPSPADTGGAETDFVEEDYPDDEDYPETSTVGMAKLAENMNAKLASTGDTPQPQDALLTVCSRCAQRVNLLGDFPLWKHEDGSLMCQDATAMEETQAHQMKRLVVLPAMELAKKFHETYERLAPQFGYETRRESAKLWADVPENNKKLMIAVCGEILATLPAREAKEK